MSEVHVMEWSQDEPCSVFETNKEIQEQFKIEDNSCLREILKGGWFS